MTKILMGICGICIVALLGMGYYCVSLNTVISERTKQLEQAEQTIRVKDAQIATDQQSLSSLKENNAKLVTANAKLDQAMAVLMEKPENMKWGCENLPEDITEFIYGMECSR